jgi:hypothetical protein
MLLLLPENVNKRQVLEIQMPSGREKTAEHQTGGSVLDPPHSGKCLSQDLPGGHPFPV